MDYYPKYFKYKKKYLELLNLSGGSEITESEKNNLEQLFTNTCKLTPDKYNHLIENASNFKKFYYKYINSTKSYLNIDNYLRTKEGPINRSNHTPLSLIISLFNIYNEIKSVGLQDFFENFAILNDMDDSACFLYSDCNILKWFKNG